MRLVAGLRGVQEFGIYAGLVQRADLVVHQRDQRRYHHRSTAPGAVAGDRGKLVTQAFAPASGHQHQRVTTRAHVLNDCLLRTAKLGVAEDFGEYGEMGHKCAQRVGRECSPVDYARAPLTRFSKRAGTAWPRPHGRFVCCRCRPGRRWCAQSSMCGAWRGPTRPTALRRTART